MFKKLIQTLQVRYKAVVAALGAVLSFLYQIETANPNRYVEAAILVLLVLGVHQIPNKTQ